MTKIQADQRNASVLTVQHTSGLFSTRTGWIFKRQRKHSIAANKILLLFYRAMLCSNANTSLETSLRFTRLPSWPSCT